MPSIFRKLKSNTQKEGLDSIIPSNKLIESEDIDATDKLVGTSLSIHPYWDIPNEQVYVYRFLNNELQPLKPNQISLSGIQYELVDGNLHVTAFIRNSVNKSINLGDTSLLLLDDQNELVASHTFHLSEVGEIPAESSRPWVFVFPEQTLNKTDFSKENWTLAFNLTASQHKLDLEDSWEESLSSEAKAKLQKIVEQLQPPKDKEVNFQGLEAKILENGDLAVTLLIRNGNLKDINLQQIPLIVMDVDKNTVAEGQFILNQFTVKANTSKPWTFIFKKSMLKQEEPNLSKWSVGIAN